MIPGEKYYQCNSISNIAIHNPTMVPPSHRYQQLVFKKSPESMVLSDCRFDLFEESALSNIRLQLKQITQPVPIGRPGQPKFECRLQYQYHLNIAVDEYLSAGQISQ